MRTVGFGLINLIATFSVAITTLFVACIGMSVTEVMPRTIPGFVLFAVADGIFIRVVCRLAGFAVPKAVRTSRVKGVRPVALRAVPMRIAVRRIGSHMVRLLLRTVPAMRTTFRCGMHPAFDTAIPIAVLAVGTNDVMRVTGVTPPVIGTIFGFFDDFIAVLTEQTTAVTAFVETEGSFALSVARPAMRASFGRRIGGFATRIGTVPAIAVAHRIPVGRMVRFAGGTCPVMVATFGRSQNLSALAFGTEGIAAIAGNRFRNHIHAITVGTMPARVAVPARGENRVAIGAPPVFPVADTVRRMLFVTIGTIPDIGAGLPDVQNGFVFGTIPVSVTDKTGIVMFAAGLAIPEMRAIFGFSENFTASGTVTTIFRTGRIQRMTLFAFGTIPKVFACLADVANGFAGRAIPMIVTHEIGVMVFAAGFACPIVFAIFVFSQNFAA